MLAHGVKCSVGDQLHLKGEICQTTYDLIGFVYLEVEKKELWCVDAKPVADIAVMTSAEFTGERIPLSMRGLFTFCGRRRISSILWTRRRA